MKLYFKNPISFICVFLFLISFYLPLSRAAGVKPEKIIIAVQPTVATNEILEKAKPLEAALEEKLGNGVDVEIYAPMSYAAVVEALRFGHADAALMGAWPARLAVRLANAELPLAEVREVIQGKEKVEAPYYSSYWIVSKDSSYNGLKDLKNKNVCFPSPVSTSGYVAPLGKLVESGLLVKQEGKEADPKSFFGNVIFGGGYQQCWTALQNGQVDVAVIAGDVPEPLYREVLAQTRIIAEQGAIPSHALLIGKRMKEPLRSNLISAIKALGIENRDLMRNFVSGIFVRFEDTSAEEHLKGLNQYLDSLGLQYTERIG